MYENIFLVLLYNKEICDSDTLSSFLKFEIDFSRDKLVIWNNGPKKLNDKNIREFVNVGFDVELIETIENRSLSKIYNQIIREEYANKYIILDDDSNLSREYFFDVFSSTQKEFCVPIISADGKVIGPRINRNVVSSEVICGPNDRLLAIGSGMVLGRELISTILREYPNVFDERFYFYGVDITFCLRVNDLKVHKRVISGFDHSLSRLEKDDNYQLSNFRQNERACDFALRTRYYNRPVLSFVKFLRAILLFICKMSLNKKNSYSLSMFIKTYINGSHYRSRH